jgi:putative ABC transport system permease protein
LIALTLAAMTATALVLALCAWLTVRALALMRARTSMSWRFGLANVARRARLSVVQVTAVGLGLAVILLLALVRNDLLSQWRARLPPDTPNQFLINVQGDEREALAQFIRAASGRRVEFYPMVRGRLVAINDAKVIADRYVDQRARRLADREFNLSWATAPKADNRIVAGHWWSPASSGELSVEEGLAKALGLALGDELTFQVAERRLRARITNLRAVDWDNFQVNFFVVATPEWLQDEPATYITSVRVEPTQSRAMTRLVARFPSVTVIDVDALMRQVLQIMDRVVAALTGVFALALAAGGLVLGAAVQASQRTRLHDTVLLKTLGASRRFVRAATLGEFAVLGLVAGLIGSLAALAMGWLLAHQVFDTPYVPDPLIVVGGIAAGMGGFIVVGLLAVGRVMRVPTSVGLRDVG